MDRTESANADRWRLYRLARERGMSESEAYDRYLYPQSRTSATELALILAGEEALGSAIPTNRAG